MQFWHQIGGSDIQEVCGREWKKYGCDADRLRADQQNQKRSQRSWSTGQEAQDDGARNRNALVDQNAHITMYWPGRDGQVGWGK